MDRKCDAFAASSLPTGQKSERMKRELENRNATESQATSRPPARQVHNDVLMAVEHATKGIAFSVLEDLAAKLEPNATFHEAKTLILKKTEDTRGQRSLAAHYSQDPNTSHLVANAEYFVSYAWSGSFHDTVSALASHFIRGMNK